MEPFFLFCKNYIQFFIQQFHQSHQAHIVLFLLSGGLKCTFTRLIEHLLFFNLLDGNAVHFDSFCSPFLRFLEIIVAR